MSITNGSRWIHADEGLEVVVKNGNALLQIEVKTLLGFAWEWVDAVSYEHVDPTLGREFIRSKERFLDRFTPVKGPSCR